MLDEVSLFYLCNVRFPKKALQNLYLVQAVTLVRFAHWISTLLIAVEIPPIRIWTAFVQLTFELVISDVNMVP